MAEFVHTFTSGKMNKDLDERLVPDGEYVDALNIELSTSGSGNVGALQNIKGNILCDTASKHPITGVITKLPLNMGLVDPISVGSIVDTGNEKIYWFIKSVGTSCIAEYDQTTSIISPIIVDREGILNFSEDYLITGINIIEGLLFFTDNQTEPKKIEIAKYKLASKPTGFTSHTKVHNRPFVESDITVIKRVPLTAPTIHMSNTRELDSEGNAAVVTTNITYNFTTNIDGEVVDFPISTPEFTMNWNIPYPFYKVDDILVLTSEGDTDSEGNDYIVRLKVVSVPDAIAQPSATVVIQSISGAPSAAVVWTVELEQEPPLFEFKFPRFAYREKYDNGEYSIYSPFSEIAFLPDSFLYNTFRGYNLGMTNTVRRLEIKNFISNVISEDVVEVDLLYKESNSSNIYIVDTFKPGSEEWVSNSFDLKSELIGANVESMQLLRPWDNVPLKAKSQEVTANRLVYGNYLQNFDLNSASGIPIKPDIDISIAQSGAVVVGEPNKSLKTLRTYQAGVVYNDAYGRQTPVLTSKTASTILSKKQADRYNQLNLKLKNDPPEFATGFRFFVKETSNEYYNLAMDRYYLAEDNNVWLSFPSSERNKVAEDTFLILKKQHNNDVFVEEDARYKIIDISNEAPDILKATKKPKGKIETPFTDTGYPIADRKFVEVPKLDWEGSVFKTDTFNINTLSDLWLKIFSNSGKTEWYSINSISFLKTGAGDEVYRIELEKKLVDVDFTGDGIVPSLGLGLEISQLVYESKPEFSGRFFVKIYNDIALMQNILSEDNVEDYSVSTVLNMPLIQGKGPNADGFWQGVKDHVYFKWYIDGNQADRTRDVKGTLSPYGKVIDNTALGSKTGRGIKVNSTTIDINFHGWGGNEVKGWEKDAWKGFESYSEVKPYVDFIQLMESGGMKFRFKNDPNSTIYTALEYRRIDVLTVDDSSGGTHKRGKFKRSRAMRWTLLLDKPILEWTPESLPGIQDYKDSSGFCSMEVLDSYSDSIEFTSDNPAIWETEPKEAIDLDLYYEASDVFPIAEHNDTKKLDWFNCYSFGNGVESNRIRDDYNAITIDKGAKVSTVLAEQYNQERRANGLIWSGIFNSTSGVNNLNQFIQADTITKDVNPSYGSIQKLDSRDSDLTVLCEDKILKIFANKDALYNADGSANLLSSNKVLGQTSPYIGEFGISKNPESFAKFGFQSYFTDKARGAVLRLSRDGLTEISNVGMSDFFSDNLSVANKIYGSFNENKLSYNVTLNKLTPEWFAKLGGDTSTTVSFKTNVNGWSSRMSFIPQGGMTLNNRYYTFYGGLLWEHNIGSINTFYDTKYESLLNFNFNEGPNSVKGYKTLNYTGTQSRKYKYDFGLNVDGEYDEANSTSELVKKGWYAYDAHTDLQEADVKEFVDKEGKWFNYFKGVSTYFNTNEDNNVDSKEFSVQGIGNMLSLVGPPQTAHTITTYIDSDCSTTITRPNGGGATVSTPEEVSLTINLSQYVLPNSGTVTYAITDSSGIYAAAGSIGSVNSSTGEVTFTPVLDYNGNAGGFFYTIDNGTFTSNPYFIDIIVTPMPDAPIFTSTPPQDAFVEFDPYAYNIVTADVDMPYDYLTVTSLNALPPGFILVDSGVGDGTAVLSNIALSSGQVNITLVVTDSAGLYAEQILSIPALDVTPTVKSATLHFNEDSGSNTISLSTYSSDPNNYPLTYIIDSYDFLGGVHTNVNAATGKLTYKPDANYNGTGGSITYHVNNGVKDSENATISIVVDAVNDAPYWDINTKIITTNGANATDLTAMREGDAFNYSIQAKDIDLSDIPSAEILTITIDSNPTWLNFSVNNNVATLSSTATPVGQFTFTLTVTDSAGASADHIVKIGSDLAGSLATLVIKGHTNAGGDAFDWVDSDGDTIKVPAPVGVGHGCNQGTFLLMLEGVEIGRIYIANAYGTGYFDSYTLNGTTPNSPTGDIHTSGTALNNIPSAAIGSPFPVSNTKVISLVTEYTDHKNTTYELGRARVNIVKLKEATIQSIVAIAANPKRLKLVVIPDTYNSNGNLWTHAEGFGLQMFINKKAFFNQSFGMPDTGSYRTLSTKYQQVISQFTDPSWVDNTVVFNGLTGEVVEINGFPQ